MAHEVAHVAERHAAEQLTKGDVANGLLGLLGAALDKRGKGEAAARIGASVATQIVFLKFSRDDEREADRVGAEIVRRAGWDRTGWWSSSRCCSGTAALAELGRDVPLLASVAGEPRRRAAALVVARPGGATPTSSRRSRAVCVGAAPKAMPKPTHV